MRALALLLVLPMLALNVGHSVITLDGPWRFNTGDNPHWADPDFDDRSWGIVDLTAPPGAHDPDEGLSGYVPGWNARGYRYGGYAWYRMRILVRAAPSDRLAIAGPLLVDQAYQLFVNGTLLGGSGTFNGSTPAVYATHPSIFPLHAGAAPIAIRVWMSPRLAGAADAGGIHIAPAIGEADGIDLLYRVQWLERVRAFVVDIVEPAIFVLLAVMAACLIRFDPKNPAYPCLVVALLLTAIARANLAFYSLAHYETAREFIVIVNGIVIPLWFGAWTATWITWFRLQHHRWLLGVTASLTALSIAGQQLGIPAISTNVRYLFAAMLVAIVALAVLERGRETWFALPAVALVACALFAAELSSLGVPGIWFPFDTGLSRTQIAYAALDAFLFFLLFARLDRLVTATRAP